MGNLMRGVYLSYKSRYTFRENSLVTAGVSLSLSRRLTVKVKVPGFLGMPEIIPVK